MSELTVTPELLDEIEAKAKAAPSGHYTKEVVCWNNGREETCVTRIREDGIKGYLLTDVDDELANHIASMDPPMTLALTAAHRAALARIRELEASVVKYEARLEIDHCFDINGNRKEIPIGERGQYPDGIECRNATIGLLEDRIAELKAENAGIRQKAIEDAAAVLSEVAGGTHTVWDERVGYGDHEATADDVLDRLPEIVRSLLSKEGE